MIVGVYTTHLYCDCKKCKDDPGMKWRGGVDEVSANTFAQTIKLAKLRGWKFNKEITEAYAPKHKK